MKQNVIFYMGDTYRKCAAMDVALIIKTPIHQIFYQFMISLRYRFLKTQILQIILQIFYQFMISLRYRILKCPIVSPKIFVF